MKARRVEWVSVEDGWITIKDPDVALDLSVWPVQLEDRVVIGALRLSAAQGVRTGALKSVRLDRYEAAMNRPGVGDLVAAVLRGDGSSRIIRRATEDWRHFDLTVPDTPGARYPDAFYSEVAGYYMAMLEAGYSPAIEMSKATGKPPSTVRRWIAECRRREILPKGRKGKAG
jgi:hypothetical protein